MLLQRREQKDEREREREAHCPLEVIKEVAAKGTGGRVVEEKGAFGGAKRVGRRSGAKENLRAN